MRRMRRLAKNLICADFWIQIAGELVFAVLALVGGGIYCLSGDGDLALQTFGRALAGIGMLCFVWWVAKDAKKHAKRLRAEREASKAKLNDESPTEIAGIPPRPPWMG